MSAPRSVFLPGCAERLLDRLLPGPLEAPPTQQWPRGQDDRGTSGLRAQPGPGDPPGTARSQLAGQGLLCLHLLSVAGRRCTAPPLATASTSANNWWRAALPSLPQPSATLKRPRTSARRWRKATSSAPSSSMVRGGVGTAHGLLPWVRCRRAGPGRSQVPLCQHPPVSSDGSHAVPKARSESMLEGPCCRRFHAWSLKTACFLCGCGPFGWSSWEVWGVLGSTRLYVSRAHQGLKHSRRCSRVRLPRRGPRSPGMG